MTSANDLENYKNVGDKKKQMNYFPKLKSIFIWVFCSTANFLTFKRKMISQNVDWRKIWIYQLIIYFLITHFCKLRINKQKQQKTKHNLNEI